MKKISIIILALACSLSFFLNVAAQELPPPSPFCDELLPLNYFERVLEERGEGIQLRTTSVITEDDERCSRIYYKGEGSRFSDELIMLVSPARDSDGARSAVMRIAREAEEFNSFGLAYPENLGDTAVVFILPDPLSEWRVQFNVTFALNESVVELKYYNVDDGLDNKFIYSLSELTELARLVAQ